MGENKKLLCFINADADNSTLLEIDSTFCKVHQSGCSGLKDQAMGMSRGGKNTKVHVMFCLPRLLFTFNLPTLPKYPFTQWIFVLNIADWIDWFAH